MQEIDELLSICRYGGNGVLMVQGAGGNASVKNYADRTIWIKASGYRLSQLRRDYGYLRLRLPDMHEFASSLAGLETAEAHEASVSLMQSIVADSTDLRPSLEAWFHLALGRVVLHTHPVYANAFACMQGGEVEFRKLLANEPVLIDYYAPGYALGEAVRRAAASKRRQNGKAASQILLANHGLITSGENVAEIVRATNDVLYAGIRFFGVLDRDDLASETLNPNAATWARDLRKAYCKRTGTFAAVSRPARFRTLRLACDDPEQWIGGALVPDDVVCNVGAVWFADPVEPAERWLESVWDDLPSSASIFLRGAGVVFLGPSHKMIEAMEEQLVVQILVRRLISRRGTVRPLPADEVDYIVSMESEKHRQAVLAQDGAECRS